MMCIYSLSERHFLRSVVVLVVRVLRDLVVLEVVGVASKNIHLNSLESTKILEKTFAYSLCQSFSSRLSSVLLWFLLESKLKYQTYFIIQISEMTHLHSNYN